MKLIALVLSAALAVCCLTAVMAMSPGWALLCAFGAGGLFAWIETVEQREFNEHMRRAFGDEWDARR